MLDLLGKGTDRGYSMIGVGLSAGLSGSRRARTVQDPLPALDLDWATNRSLPASYGPTPTFTRASTGTYFDGQGILKSASVNGPRFNHVYNGTSWVSRGLLVEEQRTNLLTNSGNIYGGWPAQNMTTDSNKATAPDSTTLVDKLIPTTVNSDHTKYILASITNGLTYSYTVYGKKAELYRMALVFYDGTFMVSNFNLNNGTVLQTGSGCTAEISAVGNGWFRCTVTRVSALTGTGFFYVMPNNIDNPGLPNLWAGDGTSGLYAWGAQLEAGAFPTSYIPTTSSSVTRSADVCQITGSDFSGFWNGTEGAIAYEADSFSSDIANQVVFQASDGTLNNQYQSARSQNNAYTDVGFWVKTGNTWQALIQTAAGAWLQNATSKNAMAYKANDFAFSNAGSTVLTDTSGTLPTVDRINIGQSVSGNGFINGHIARLRYFPVRLTNAKLQELST